MKRLLRKSTNSNEIALVTQSQGMVNQNYLQETSALRKLSHTGEELLLSVIRTK